MCDRTPYGEDGTHDKPEHPRHHEWEEHDDPDPAHPHN